MCIKSKCAKVAKSAEKKNKNQKIRVLSVLEFKAHCKCLQGITGDLQGKPAISMEKGCKNHRETLYSSKGKIAYIVEKPCNSYRLRGNPIIIMGFPGTYSRD